MATILTPNEIAIRFQTDAKTLRRFLRASAGQEGGFLAAKGYQAPGKGSRWAIKGADMSGLRGAFNRWAADEAKARAERAAKAAQEAETEAQETEADEDLTEED